MAEPLPEITSASAAQGDVLLPARKLDDRFRIVRDRVYGVAHGHYHGFYLHGPPGVSKSYTVLTTLAEIGITPPPPKSVFSPMGLFDELREHSEQVIVLDDVARIFANEQALQILLAALGNLSGAAEGRRVGYRYRNHLEEFVFTGGIIFISNILRHDTGLFAALKSRVHLYELDPTHEELVVLFRRVAARGWACEHGAMTPTECSQVAEFVIAESERQTTPLDMRLLVDKGFGDYLQHRVGRAETHWEDLIRVSMQERVRELTQPVQARRPTRAQEQAELRRIATGIQSQFPTRTERLAAWTEATGGLSESSYRRHVEVVEPTPLSA